MRWLATEVIQTSAMDCGPAALKCLLEGFNISVSYGRLREACQTSVDGTSIDRLEEVANQLGLHAEQVMLPTDHIFLSSTQVLPAMFVVRHPDGATHFVVVWRRYGSWLQVMDPAVGRRWIRTEQFLRDIYHHEYPVSDLEWLQWAGSEEFLQPLRQRLSSLGISKNNSASLILQAQGSADWFSYAKLDASIRLVASLVAADALKAGASAFNLIQTFYNQVRQEQCFAIIPMAYWSVTPQQTAMSDEKNLLLKGAVLLQIKAKTSELTKQTEAIAPLTAELEAALQGNDIPPLKTIFEFLRADGLLAPLALLAALTLSAVAVLIETLLFRGIFDIAWQLKLASQRLEAMAGLITFVAVLMLVEIPIALESLRFGRQMEIKLRMALLRKLPRLPDRYFQSRPLSDMAERSHSIVLSKQVPALGIQVVQTLWEIIFTLLGIALIDITSAPLAIIITALAILLPLLAQPLLNEKDLRLRSHSGALFGFYLDALLGLVPIRTHRAEQAIRREHEGLLVEWARTGRSMIQLSLWVTAMQSLICFSLVILLLYQHFLHAGKIMGADLLLIYWALKLPAAGQAFAGLAKQYPAQRNVLLRLLEPLSAPEEIDEQPPSATESQQVQIQSAVKLDIHHGKIVAGGHTILDDINLQIAPGEHIAIVGSSGAGKSTLLALLLGWHKLASGELRIDEQQLSITQQNKLRQATAWVDPAIQIWNASFLDNLTYSAGANSIDHIAEALDAANLRSVVQKLPAGLQTYLGEGGALLSGGEGQRVRLGRALLQTDVRLVLLDEPFRGLDRDQRKQLLADTRAWWQASTLLCVTHDVEETLPFARVLVIDEGRIVEDDNPIALAARDSRYRALLHAERRVRKTLWDGYPWRRIEVKNGYVNSIDQHE